MSDETRKRESGLVLMTLPLGIKQGRSEEFIVWMSRPVAARLRALGFEQPVMLDALPGRWWGILVDLAALGRTSEPGCGFAKTMASTEAIAGCYSAYWCQIAAGPFDSADEGETALQEYNLMSAGGADS